jgi:hypothetical protein
MVVATGFEPALTNLGNLRPSFGPRGSKNGRNREIRTPTKSFGEIYASQLHHIPILTI